MRIFLTLPIGLTTIFFNRLKFTLRTRRSLVMFRQRVLVVPVLDLSLIDTEIQFQHIFYTVPFLIRISRYGFILFIKVLLCCQVSKDQMSVKNKHHQDKNNSRYAENSKND